MSQTGRRFFGGLVVLALITVATLHAPIKLVHAQTSNSSTGSGSTDAYKQQLQNQLNQIEAQIAQQQQILTQAQGQAQTLQHSITVLDAQIDQAQLSIQARNIQIQELTSNIADKQNTISGLNTQLGGELESLAAIFREQNQLDTTSLVVAALSSENLSDFFSDTDTFDEINGQMQQSFNQISSTKTTTQQQEDDLSAQRDQESQLLEAQQLQEQQIQSQENQKNQILAETKGQESAYQALIAKNQKSASQIRAALFSLSGSAAISFGTALNYANEASKQTGIRPAFLLGLIEEESNLGQNVGTGTFTTDSYNCYIGLGAPTSAAKQKAAFDSITQSLGLDPDSMPVSKKQNYGCGGAMGPAQFIATTWALYAGYTGSSWTYTPSADRIGPLTGDRPPSPWNPQDAFMAAALYLTDDGAAKQTPSAEFTAAMCYLAGCGNTGQASLQFYGNQVLCNEVKYQEDIDTITGSNNAPAMESNALYYGQC
jgi:peptidoglycan hydrolase CwlO-like protein